PGPLHATRPFDVRVQVSRSVRSFDTTAHSRDHLLFVRSLYDSVRPTMWLSTERRSARAGLRPRKLSRRRGLQHDGCGPARLPGRAPGRSPRLPTRGPDLDVPGRT